MGFKCGIVGLPNVGKSTLFNALTQSHIEAQNYPFCTIEPNTGVVEVPDERLYKISKINQSAKTIPTLMEFVDIAGLVAGASKGEGLGNQFLGHIRSVQAIAHVVRCFEDDNITHVEGKINPINDIATIETELALADIQTLEKAQVKLQKLTRAGDKKAQQEINILTTLIDKLSNDQHLQEYLSEENIQEICQKYQLLCSKPVFFIANIAEQNPENNTLLKQVQQHAQKRNSPVVTICASIENELSGMEQEEKIEFLNEIGIKEPGLNQVIRQGHKLLGLSCFFTAGPKESRAWTIQKSASAQEAAGAIHSDFSKHFIRAEVISWQDYIENNGEKGAKEAGLWRLEGKEYKVKDGDVITIRSSA